MKILVATPSKDDTVFTSYLHGALALQRHFLTSRSDAEIVFSTRTGLVIDRARNLFATRVLLDPSFTHLLFIDADVGFGPDLIVKMVDFDQPIVAAMYPRRERSTERWLQIAEHTRDGAAADAGALSFVSEAAMVRESVEGGATVPIRDGFVRVAGAGGGMLLIKRQALEAMRAVYSDLWVDDVPELRIDPTKPNGLFQCFAPMADTSGFLLGEDTSFCRRWIEGCGGEIWSCVTHRLSHSGPTTFTGSLAEKMTALGHRRNNSTA